MTVYNKDKYKLQDTKGKINTLSIVDCAVMTWPMFQAVRSQSDLGGPVKTSVDAQRTRLMMGLKVGVKWKLYRGKYTNKFITSDDTTTFLNHSDCSIMHNWSYNSCYSHTRRRSLYFKIVPIAKTNSQRNWAKSSSSGIGCTQTESLL